MGGLLGGLSGAAGAARLDLALHEGGQARALALRRVVGNDGERGGVLGFGGQALLLRAVF